MPTFTTQDWNSLDVLDLSACAADPGFTGGVCYSGVISANNLFQPEGEVLWLPFSPEYLMPENGMSIIGAGDACGSANDGLIAADLVQFFDGPCPICKEQVHSIDDSECKNPGVSIRSEWWGCRRCYDAKYTGLANRYLYDMCRLMGLEFDWLA